MRGLASGGSVKIPRGDADCRESVARVSSRQVPLSRGVHALPRVCPNPILNHNFSISGSPYRAL